MLDVRLAEDDEEVALAGVLQVAGHVEVGVHARLEDRDPPQLVKLRGVGFVVERAGDQDIEVRVRGLAGGCDEIGTRDRAELGADEDGGALLRARINVALDVAPVRADEIARPRRERGKRDPVFLVGLLDAGGLEVLQDHAGEILLFAVAELGFRHAVDELVVLVNAQHAVGRNALHREGTGDADLPVVLVGLVVEVFVVRLGGDGGVDRLLAGDARLPPIGVQRLGVVRAKPSAASREISHSSQEAPSALFNCSRNGSSVSFHFSQITSISALLAMDLSVMWGTRSYTKPWRMLL